MIFLQPAAKQSNDVVPSPSLPKSNQTITKVASLSMDHKVIELADISSEIIPFTFLQRSMGILYSICGIFGMIFEFFLIFAIIKKGDLSNIDTRFILSLCLSDLLFTFPMVLWVEIDTLLRYPRAFKVRFTLFTVYF